MIYIDITLHSSGIRGQEEPLARETYYVIKKHEGETLNEILYLILGLIIGLVIGIILYFYMKTKLSEKEREINEIILQTRKETGDRQRAVLKGKIGEQMAPLLSEFYFKYELSDARFIGQPIDYVIFKNLTKLKDEIQNKVPPNERSEIEIILADIKTGGSQLNTEQRKIRNAVQDGRISWDEIRIDLP